MRVFFEGFTDVRKRTVFHYVALSVLFAIPAFWFRSIGMGTISSYLFAGAFILIPIGYVRFKLGLDEKEDDQ